jgi:transcriptional regulator with XRE-family HTH domain
MVDKPQQRITPADPPEDFDSFAEWLVASTGRRGMPSELAKYCGKDRQLIQRWLTGSIPQGPELRKLIAGWARVDYESLRALLYKTEEAKRARAERESTVAPQSRTARAR